MSTRPDLEVESKKDFFAQINLGLKAEYEFGTGIDCFKFITNELGLNFVKTEDVVSKKREAVRRTRSKTQNVLNVRNEKCLLNKVKMGCLVSKEKAKVIGICSDKSQTSVTKLGSKIEHIINSPLQNEFHIQLQEITKFKDYFNSKNKFEINEPFSEETSKNETVKESVSDSNQKYSIARDEINLEETESGTIEYSMELDDVENDCEMEIVNKSFARETSKNKNNEAGKMESENVQNSMELDDLEIINKKIAGETRKNENTETVKVVPISNKGKFITINKINLKEIHNENVQNSIDLDLVEIIKKRITGETRKNENTGTVKVVPNSNKIKFITISKINLKGLENDNAQNSIELDLMEIIKKRIAGETRKNESNETDKVVSISNRKDFLPINETNLKVIENENVKNSIEVDDMENDSKMDILNKRIVRGTSKNKYYETVKESVSNSNRKDFIAINEINLIEMESTNVQNSRELDDLEIINERIAEETRKNETVSISNQKDFIAANEVNLEEIEYENVQNSMEADNMKNDCKMTVINKRIERETSKNKYNETVKDCIAIKEINYLLEMETKNAQNSMELEIITKRNGTETRKNKDIEMVKESASNSNNKDSIAINEVNLKEIESENIKNSKELCDMKNDSKMEIINKRIAGETRKNETVEELETNNSISWETSQKKRVDKKFLIQDIRENDVEIIDLVDNEEQLEETNTRFLCFICQKRFSNKAMQRKHIGLHLSNQSKLTTCPFCGKNFFEKKALSQHFTTHLSKKEMISKQCDICLKMFCKTSNVIRHINTIHKKEKENTVFENSIDPSVFNQKEQKNNLSNEMVDAKDNESKCEEEAVKHLQKTFKCEMCEGKFTTKYHLQRHNLIIHAGQRHFECPVCLKRVSSKYHLKQHLATHTAPKIYSCKFCYNKYYSLNSFRRHSKEHEKK